MILSSTEKYILVVGLGKSGISASKFFRRKGYEVVATDINPARKDAPQTLELESLGIKTEIGPHNIETFENAGLIVVSPGIPLDGDHFQKAIKKSIPIRGEMDIAAELIKEPIVAITGTNGKTTVTTLISEMLKCSGFKVFTGGNIGTPLIEYLNQTELYEIKGSDKPVISIDKLKINGADKSETVKSLGSLIDNRCDVVVVEVSSFQLDTAQNFSPDVAVLLNITEDHMNRYPDFRAYEDSKWSIFSGQNEKCHAIINSRIQSINTNNSKVAINSHIDINDLQNSRLANIRAKITLFNTDEELFTAQKQLSKLKGKHNQENIEASILAALCAGASMEGIESALKSFKGLPHRIEYVATINGIEFYNDSKGTNTDATARAIESFDKKGSFLDNHDSFAKKSFASNIILIMGGQDKNMDFSVLKEWINGRIKLIVLMGETKDKIYKALAGSCDMIFADNMKHAVNLSFSHAKSGDTVLLSSACASFDMYGSYTERGDDFKRQVKSLI
ncbi:MAG: UDP-N-acetylmuramoyl-L-alanine--D-glutamate ligase [Desulfamplus sp.]|nr:UDP-N-acetylmuramoyl-L-alanine--D-glutamate ligase [Desulfamplus sp.]